MPCYKVISLGEAEENHENPPREPGIPSVECFYCNKIPGQK
jgi:hypothetical protein